jgi:hypothetical protein
MLNKTSIIKAFAALGEKLDPNLPEVLNVMEKAYQSNNWFTEQNVTLCLNNWRDCLTETNLSDWLNEVPEVNPMPRSIGIIMAGNIPLVGFHDLLSVIATGHRAVIKLAQKDEELIKYCLNVLESIAPSFSEHYEIRDRIVKPEALIATGSNNSARYFEYYFKDIPCIIRKNRTSVAILNGNESTEDLTLLADDIFQYFGLGCRNVTKLLVPVNYDLIPLLDATAGYNDIANHHKYANNTTYHRAIFLMNLTKHLDTGYLLVKEDEKLHAPLSCLFYEYYSDEKTLNDWLIEHNEEIQVIVSNKLDSNHQAFGSTQQPMLTDYADGVNTLQFLLNL